MRVLLPSLLLSLLLPLRCHDRRTKLLPRRSVRRGNQETKVTKVYLGM